jgi:hypothetical protein
VIVVIIVLLIVLSAVARGCAGRGGDSGKSSTGSDPGAKEEAKKKGEKKEKSNEKSKKKEDPNPNFSNGMHQVGTDLQPGTYRIRKDSRGCCYAPLGDFSGELEEILANGNANEPTIVTIAPTDANFESQRCWA